MKCITCLLVASLLPFLIGSAAYPANPQQDISEFYSFENDMEGWTTKGTDLVLNEWSITRSQDMAKEGSSSLKLDLFNRNDNGKIWVEKAFTVEPNQIYQASVEYSLASAEFVARTAWVVLTGVLNKSPQNAIDLGLLIKTALRITVSLVDSHGQKEGTISPSDRTSEGCKKEKPNLANRGVNYERHRILTNCSDLFISHTCNQFYGYRTGVLFIRK